MPARSAPAYSAQRQQRELADLQLVVRARNGDQVALDALIRRYTGFVRLKASSYFLAGGDCGRPDPGRADRPLQGCARLPPRQGDLVPQLRRALRHAPDHHGDQDRYSLQALAAEHVRLVLDTRRRARTPTRTCTLGDALPGPSVDDPLDLRDLDRGAAEPRVLASAPGSRSSRPTRCSSTSRAPPTRRWRRSSAATRRRSTTRCSGSSARCSSTSRRARVLQ